MSINLGGVGKRMDTQDTGTAEVIKWAKTGETSKNQNLYEKEDVFEIPANEAGTMKGTPSEKLEGREVEADQTLVTTADRSRFHGSEERPRGDWIKWAGRTFVLDLAIDKGGHTILALTKRAANV